MPRNTILLVALWLIFLLTTSACSSGNKTKLDSDDFGSTSARVSALEKEIISPSSFADTEFELFNVNGFSNDRSSIPGASSRDYQYVIKLSPTDVLLWTEDMVSLEGVDQDLSWMQQIVQKRPNTWKTETQPEYFKRPGGDVILVVYRQEGIVYKRVTDL